METETTSGVERLTELQFRGKRILHLDLAGMQLRDKGEFYEAIEAVRKRVEQEPAGSVLAVTNVTNSAFDADIARAITACARYNAPHIKASAVVGVAGIQKVVLSAIKAQTGRSFYIASTLEEALSWLQQQS
ncbi:MAG: hypothetical protein MUE68_07335 [Bacteroidetes bacterium]|jgi:hypothetical protein|nr:hypothetical protein [Bacteroidota bacterium]